MNLKPPSRRFLRTAGRADRCSQTFRSRLNQGPDHVGSDPAEPHTFESSVKSSYRLSYFPRSQLRKRRRALKHLPDGTQFDEWGAHGTGNQRC